VPTLLVFPETGNRGTRAEISTWVRKWADGVGLAPAPTAIAASIRSRSRRWVRRCESASRGGYGAATRHGALIVADQTEPASAAVQAGSGLPFRPLRSF
jgi:hypothetical protein